MVLGQFQISVADTDEVVPGQIVFLDSDNIPTVISMPRLGQVRNVILNLGDWSDRFTLILPEFGGAKWYQLKARQRQLRCVTISGEGPHLDFDNWMPQSTPWRELKKVQNIKWMSGSFASTDYGPAPKIPLDKIENLVRNALKDSPEQLDRWLTLGRECHRNPQSCISDCKSEIQFFEDTPGKENIILTLTIRIPMGC